MDKKTIVLKALNQEFLTIEEGLYLFDYLPTPELMWVANEIKKDLHPSNKITWQIDRNVNTTNACIANCKFCNFFRVPGHKDVYITDLNTYKKKLKRQLSTEEINFYYRGGTTQSLGLNST